MSRDTAGSAVRNIYFGGVRLVIGAGATICISAMIARTLGPEKMGIYGYTMWLVGALGILANLGLPTAITKYISQYLGRGEAATAVHVGRRLLRAQFAAAVGVSGLTACFIFANTPYRGIVLLAALMLFSQALLQSLGAVLAGVQKFDSLALIGIYVALAQVAFVGIAVFLHAEVIGMLWATFAGLTLATWLYYRAVGKCFQKLSPQPYNALPATPDIFRRIRGFSFTISYLLLLDAIVWQRSEVLFLRWYSTVVEIGFYTIAYSIATKLSDVTSVFASTLLPLYSESHSRHGLLGLGPVYLNALKYTLIIVVPLGFLGAAISGPSVQLIYGASYLPLVRPLQLLLLTLAFTGFGVVGSPLLVGTEKQGFMAKFGTAIAILNISLDLILIPRYGALGAAGANCAAQLAGVFGGTIYVVHYIQVSFPWKTIATIYLAAAIAMTPVAYVGGRTTWGITALVGSIAVGGVLYLGLLAASRELRKSDFRVLRRALMKKVQRIKPVAEAQAA